jgi:Uma2 family endonuclease
MTISPFVYRAPGTPWTVEDLKALPDDDLHLYEVYCGSLLVTPRPGVRHGGVVPEAALANGGDAFMPADVLLVVEVLSPSNARYDLVVKWDEYAIAGIPLYWIVDPDKQTLTALELAADGTYREAAVVTPGEVWCTDKPFPLAFDLAEIF